MIRLESGTDRSANAVSGRVMLVAGEKALNGRLGDTVLWWAMLVLGSDRCTRGVLVLEKAPRGTIEAPVL